MNCLKNEGFIPEKINLFFRKVSAISGCLLILFALSTLQSFASPGSSSAGENRNEILPSTELYNVSQQTKTISGTVTDQTGEVLIGVNVVVKGTSIGTSTDFDGKYTLPQVPANATIVATYIGFIAQEKVVGSASVYDFIMVEDSQMLDEVVVVGYGTMRKKDLTGSVVQIRPDKLAIENPKTVQDILRGTAGMAVNYEASAKGGGSIQIRGQRSVYTEGGHNEPLIIVDGMMFFGEMSEINPDDIGQIDVLKDGSAAAIYGAKAANGVIIITTKKGKLGKPVVNVSVSVGATKKSAYREMWNADGYMKHREDYYKAATYGLNTTTGVYEAYQTGSAPRGYFDNPNTPGLDLNAWRTTGSILPFDGESDRSLYGRRMGLGGEGTQLLLDNYVAGNTYDWWKHTFRTGFNQDYNASVSGASDRINYYMSFGYQKNEGAVSGNFFDNIRSNVKVEGKVNKWLDIGANINFQKRSDGDLQPNLSTNDYDAANNQLRNSPFSIYKNEDGTLAQYPSGVSARLPGKNFDFDRQYMELDKGFYVLNTIFNAKITLPFGISYTFNAQPRYQWFHDYYWESAAHPSWATSNNGLVNRENNWRFDWSLNNQIHWNQTFAQVHNVNVTLVQESERVQSWKDRIEARNFQPSDALGFHNTANSTKDNSSYSTEDTKHSADALLARVFYTYNDRYMVNASIRRDGYSAFGQSNPYATFPSVGAAWTFTNEKFFNFEPLDYGKLRVTWGKNGNRSLNNPYISLANLQTGGTNRYGYIDNQGNLNNFHYLQISRMANPNLQWEKSEAWNFGLDFGLFNSRLSGTIEYYSTSTHDMIMEQSLTQFSGFSTMTTNLGEVTNKGIEISLNSTNVRNNILEWNTSFTFSLNKNEIVHLYYEYEDVLDANGNVVSSKERDDISKTWFIGQPISTIWDFKQTGIWQVNEIEEAKEYGQRPGDPKLWKNPDNPVQKNSNGQYTYNNDDKVFLGERTPPINMSLRNDITLFKDFTISFNMYSRVGHKSVSGNYLNNDNASNILVQGANEFKKEYWTPENPTNKYARIQAIGPSGATSPQRLYDRSYIRFENISASYNVPRKFISKLDIERLVVNGTVRNVGVWCKDWPYGDPETGGLATRVFTVGLSATF
jgi:TonB-linked outer membrane protein, SusC/RagA family